MSYEEFLTFVSVTICTYCGEDVVRWKKFSAFSCPMNLDRVDNSRGYEKDNCAVCCGTCNGMKSDLSLDEFAEKIYKIHQRRRQWMNK